MDLTAQPTALGFTQAVIATCAAVDLSLLVKPGTDFDSRFEAWDTDEQEFLWVNGWLFNMKEA
jgi:hypothetical protein